MAAGGNHFLAHRPGDFVAVAVQDVRPGTAQVGVIDGDSTSVEVVAEIPLGHKVALRDIAAGADVIEYGLRIGVASADIATGEHVHIHNVRSARWQTSVA